MTKFETQIYKKEQADIIGAQVTVSSDNGQSIDSIQITNKTQFDELKSKLEVLDETYVQFAESSLMAGKSIDEILENSLEKAEINATKLGGIQSDGYSKTNHTHDERYYTESEINSKLNQKANAVHIHDDRYYTESEMDAKLNGKSSTSHKHTSWATVPDVITNGVLYVNEDIRLAIFRFNASDLNFPRGGKNYYLTKTGLTTTSEPQVIPASYRPAAQACILNVFHFSLIAAVNTNGTIVVQSEMEDSQKAVNLYGVWRF